jgi:coproporphyrinogen III oxidase-like Fe-S oxidoreductase
MKAIRRSGIERISMGVQSIDPAILKVWEGLTAAWTFLQELSRQSGMQVLRELNLDIMYGFLNQSVESFEATPNLR